jgi:outer membrane protein OmpA-like peptidoglycan-associated protein
MAELRRKVSLKRKGTSVDNEPPKPPQKNSKWWLWLLPLLIIAVVAIFFLTKGDGSSDGGSGSANSTQETVVQESTSNGEAPAAAPASQGAATGTEEAAAAPEPEPAGTTEQPAAIIPYKKGEVYKVYRFPYGKDNYAQPDPELDKLAKTMTDNPGMKIRIFAYTDNISSAAFNQALSERRAKAIYDYLVSKGIDRNRLSHQGKGISTKYATNAENRRAEFILD